MSSYQQDPIQKRNILLPRLLLALLGIAGAAFLFITFQRANAMIAASHEATAAPGNSPGK